MSARKPIIAGNWKMNKTVAEAESFARELAAQIETYNTVDRVLCPPFVALDAVRKALEGSAVAVGAQNMHEKDSGAFTSQISPLMLKELVQYVIIGHSECRQFLAETDEGVNRKAKAALAHGLTPIVAVGETNEQNLAGETRAVVTRQIRAAFDGIEAAHVPQIVVAYEPIWAIGTGRSATGEQAQDVIGGMVRATLIELYGDATAQQVRIQYGGSVVPGNMEEFMSQPDIDGGLVGGASLKLADFTQLIEIAARVKGR